jgi:hypothetical protein
MNKYQTFNFDSYDFDSSSGTLDLHYSLDNSLQFTEIYRFTPPFTHYDPAVLDRALQALFFMAGVSYYKTYVPPTITIHKGELDANQAAFFSKTYQRGLGEFWYVNKLDPTTPVHFPATATEAVQPLAYNSSGQLIAVGGGKDSLVSIELLRKSASPVSTWSLNHRPQLTPLVDRVGTEHIWIERAWDTQLLDLNKQDALNGHVPISAIFACVGTVAAILYDKRDIVMSNEQSANEPTLHYQGVAINHQYSKSSEFEQDFQAYLTHNFGAEGPRYYSFLRPLSELYIAELFAGLGFEKYKGVFSSCNRAFTHASDQLFWCGECPKCAFVFLVLTPFVERGALEALWGGKNLLLDPSLEATYRQLLGIEGDKPLECVGEVKESRAAMDLAKKIYPAELAKYRYELPESYDYQAFGAHHMPPEIYAILQSLQVPQPTDGRQ